MNQYREHITFFALQRGRGHLPTYVFLLYFIEVRFVAISAENVLKVSTSEAGPKITLNALVQMGKARPQSKDRWSQIRVNF